MRAFTGLILAVVLAACEVAPIGAAPPPASLMVQRSMSAAVDSLCYGFSWTAAKDEYGAAEKYRVRVNWVGDTSATVERIVDGLKTSICVARPPRGVERAYTVAVNGIRRGTDGDVREQAWKFKDDIGDVPLPAPGPIVIDSTGAVHLPPVTPGGDTTGLALFVEPRPLSPHFDFATYTFTDFCYCLKDSDDYIAPARRYDLVMSGNQKRWLDANPKITTVKYILLTSTLDESNKDPNSWTGKFQQDAREWFAKNPQYKYESAWLHDSTSNTPADSAHRIRPYIWSTNRYFGNPGDAGYRAYTIDRVKRIVADSSVRGIFIDEMDPPNLSYYARSREYAGKDTLSWQNDVISLVRDVRAAIAPKVVQINAAGYSDRDFPKRIGVAAGSVHLELNNLATQEQPSKWALVDWYVAHDTYVDFVGAEMWTDMLKDSWRTNYPGGNYAQPVYRAKVQQLANYYMVVPVDARKVGAQLDNIRSPVTPDSVDLRIYYLNVGHPTSARRVILDTRDALGQRARVYRRDFENAVVYNRPVVYWADTKMTDTTRVTVPLPDSTSKWLLVKAHGQLVLLDSLQLRNSESAILIKTSKTTSALNSEIERLTHQIARNNAEMARIRRQLGESN